MKWKTIEIKHKDGAVIYHGPMNELPIREEYMLEKSMELYQEPEPCVIYRTHIAKKLYLAMYEKLEETLKKEEYASCDELEDYFSHIMLDTKNAVIQFQKK